MTDDRIYKLASILYECVRELQYVQDAPCGHGRSLCASAVGKALVERGMKVLGVKDLAAEHWPICKHCGEEYGCHSLDSSFCTKPGLPWGVTRFEA